MPSLRDRFESFIAWRYLYRRRRSRLIGALTLVFLALTVLAHAAVFLGQRRFDPVTGHAVLTSTIATVVSQPTLLLFIFFLLLNFFSGFTTVSIVGVVIGVEALVVVLSVTSGFQQAFRQKVLGVNAHVIVMKYGFDFSEYRDVMAKAHADKHVVSASPFVFYEGMLAAGSSTSAGSIVKGIDPALSPTVLDIRSAMRQGRVEDLVDKGAPSDGGAPLPGMMVGSELARKLKINVGDRVRLVSPKADFDPSVWSASGGSPATREFRLVGIFYTGFDEYDRRLAFVNLKEAQQLSQGGKDLVTGVEIKVDDIDRAYPLSRQIFRQLGGPPYKVIDWEELNHNLFTALRMQKVALTVILTLIVVVAAFNIVAAMTLLVIGKTKEIAILKSMGMRAAGVARLFQVAGQLIGCIGVALGIGSGLMVIAVLQRYGYQLDPRVYLIDQLPVKVNVDEVVMTACITLAICFLATLYPALKAAALRPVEGLRYE